MSCDAHERVSEWIDEAAWNDFILLYDLKPTESEEDQDLLEDICDAYRDKYL
jgi:hypothetical protein